MKDNKLEVGDKIRVENTFNNHISEIIRVTKTTAFGDSPKRKNEEIYKFNIDCSYNICEKPRQRFNTTRYTLIK